MRNLSYKSSYWYLFVLTSCMIVICRIKTFVMEAIEPYHTQLQKLLFPVFAHIFLELLIAGQKTKGIGYILNYKLVLLHKVHK